MHNAGVSAIFVGQVIEYDMKSFCVCLRTSE